MKKITFIQAGGTIDKTYERTKIHHGYNFTIGESFVPDLLDRFHPAFTYEVLSAAKKDSLDLTDQDRATILDFCQTTENKHIVVTHGTDTIATTAKILSSIADKTIVLTGAMLPARFKGTDAEFNLGIAVGAALALPPGVYIALRGLVVPWREYEAEP